VIDQQSQPSTERSRVLVLYGYHKDEVFALDAVQELQKQNLPDIRFVRFPKAISHTEDYKDPRLLIRRRFIRRFLPADYVLDVHDSPRAIDLPYYTFPACGFIYRSKLTIPNRIRNVLTRYSEEQQKSLQGRHVERVFIEEWKDMSSKYDKLSIELIPNYITKDQAISYLAGLIKTLYATRRRI
jgi:hypothetical protein